MHQDLIQSLKAIEFPLIDCLKKENYFIPAGWESAHNVGRWWEAALLTEATTGMKIPDDISLLMTMHIRALSANSLGMLLNDPELVSVSKLNEREIAKRYVETYSVFAGYHLNYHNLREAMLAYASLVQYRESHYARDAAERLLDTIERRFLDKTITDSDVCNAIGLPAVEPSALSLKYEEYTQSAGRAMEGIYRYWKASGSDRALRVLHKSAVLHRETVLCADGSVPLWLADEGYKSGHNHSYLGTLRGLALYAIEFGDKKLLESIYLTYKNVIPKYSCDYHGFTPHDLGCLLFPDENGDPLGDHASCADAAYLAFLLAVYGGYTELLTDAERLLRRLFYVQNDNGAFGIFGGSYFGKGYTIDVFTSIASTFCYLLRDLLQMREDGIYVHLHFSDKIPAAEVISERTDRQYTRILPHEKASLHIAVPAWCKEDMISVTFADNTPIPYTIEGGYLHISKENIVAEKEICVSYALLQRETIAKTWNSGQSFRVLWKGDSIISTAKLE
ncbi:MAG: hypothetical protein E7564_05120 [Ruminococcaceae bacterium]|nr:hypothetical protein [Oscillospiraceae bacterium]